MTNLDDLFPSRVLEETGPDAVPGRAGEKFVYGVSGLLDALQGRIDIDFSSIWVRGEVSSLRRPSSGHLYFLLKDAESQVRAVLFRFQARRLVFELEEGQEVLCLGRINIYPGRGDLQLIVESVEPVGEGALRLAFEQLKTRLQAEGLFDRSHKKAIPFLPGRIFVVTSPTGAAVRDFIRTARARFPGVRMVLCPVRVQGEEAPWDIINALDLIELTARAEDVVVITRGGGSMEDLWAFNHEGLARRIFDFPYPVVSAIGHEIDFTISDFVSDLRAATPTAAAQLVVPDQKVLSGRMEDMVQHLRLLISRTLSNQRHRLQALRAGLVDPRRRLADRRLRTDELNSELTRLLSARLTSERQKISYAEQVLSRHHPGTMVRLARKDLSEKHSRFERAAGIYLERRRSRLGNTCASLDAVSPLGILARGYSLVYTEDKKLVSSSEDVRPGDRITVRPARGYIECEVKSTG